MPSKFELDLLGWTTDLRVWLLDHVSDEDLAFALPGNPPLGDLIVELGDTERAYAASFRTRRLDWGTPTEDPSCLAARRGCRPGSRRSTRSCARR
jgi:hypothetical protein